MAPKIELASAAPDKVRADLLAVPVFTGPKLGPGADVVDRALGKTLLAFVSEAGFEAKRGEVLAVPTAGRLGAKAVVLVGMGDADSIDTDALRRAGAALARRSAKVEKVATTLLDAAPDALDRGDAAQALAEGIALGAYQFLTYKSDAKPSLLSRVQVLGRANTKVRDGLARGVRIAQAVEWARDLVNEPAEAKSPETVVK